MRAIDPVLCSLAQAAELLFQVRQFVVREFFQIDEMIACAFQRPDELIEL